jgi:S1-C subfamily serine protease
MKPMIVLLALLMAICGGLGYYSFSLNQQVDLLGEQLDSFRSEQAVQVGELDSNLASFRTETLTGLSRLEVGTEQNLSRIDTLSGELEANQAGINVLQEGLAETASKVEDLNDQVTRASRLTRTVMDTRGIYGEAGGAVVRISDGNRTIGSGFLYDHQAHVVTAYHVISALGQIFAVFPDGRSFPATVVGGSQFSDVAVLELESDPGIEPMVLADSATVEIGEPVAAIGSPFDLTETLTTGIVSQVDRFTDIEYDSQVLWIANLIQFDAAVNFGNSGCPLINADGEVIGLVIARVPPDEGDGIYYAVSSNKVKRVADSLIEQGSFDYPWLGIDISNLTPIYIQSRGLESVNGVLVNTVSTRGPAKAAGMKNDDVIIAFDGVAMRSVADLTSYLGEHKSPGDTATITFIRQGNELEITLEVGKRS